jgi:hypothetical protein
MTHDKIHEAPAMLEEEEDENEKLRLKHNITFGNFKKVN